MIKLNFNFDQTFLNDYFDYCYQSFISGEITKARDLINDENLKSVFDLIFNKDDIRYLVECPAEDLEKAIHTFFELLPILAERFFYTYLLRKIKVPQNCIQLPVKSCNFEITVKNTIDELVKLNINYSNLVLTPSYIKDLKCKEISLSKKKRILCRLENIARGNSSLTNKNIEKFPDWVNSIECIFSYSKMVDRYGYLLSENADTNICAYCGLEDIQLYNTDKIQVRADLDHFYPKSKFPFLAISIFNLIPSGTICNQKHKRNAPMLGFMHPCIDSLQDEVLFKFSIGDKTKIKDTLRIDVVQNNNFKDKNISLFKIKYLYDGHNGLRHWFHVLHKLREFHRANGDDLSAIDFRSIQWESVITLDEPITKVSAQKFKVDAINDLFEAKLKVTT
ncbi:TPA: hypothetical protein ACNUUK_002512 [Aeromonas salmonicida subsp. smithia]